MMKVKKKNQFHKKSSRKKTSQLGITRLTRYLVHEIEITPQKKKQNKSQSSRANNQILNDEIKKIIFKKEHKKKNLNLANIQN